MQDAGADIQELEAALGQSQNDELSAGFHLRLKVRQRGKEEAGVQTR